MTKLEERLTQLADQSVERYNDNDTHIQYKMRKAGKLSFIQGARAVLKMPELKELLAGLKFECGNRCADQNPCNAKETITKWRSFIGEVDK